MNNKFWLIGESKPDLLAARLIELSDELSNKDPGLLADFTGTNFYRKDQESAEFRFHLWGNEVALVFPGFIALDKKSGEQLPSSSQALVLYYFSTCDGTGASGQWISFSELPDGRFYNQAFQGYTGGKLAQVFQNDFDHFCLTAEKLGGKRVHLLADAAYEYNVLPMVNLLIVTWKGDEDFNATYQVLFDSAVPHHLPTDACAITASILTGRLVSESEKNNENRN
jgi:hypothetical protein